MLQEFIAPGMSFGVSAAVIPGPLIAYLINTAATQGWRKALLVVLAPLITDAPIIALMTFILGQMPAEALNIIQLAGGVLLLFIARGALRQYQAGRVLHQVSEGGAARASSWRRVLLTGIGMNFLSPGPWLFWATVNGPLLVKALDASHGPCAGIPACFLRYLPGRALLLGAADSPGATPARKGSAIHYSGDGVAAAMVWRRADHRRHWR